MFLFNRTMGPGNPDQQSQTWEGYGFTLSADGVLKVGLGTSSGRNTGCVVAQVADCDGLIEAMPPAFADQQRFLAGGSGGWKLEGEYLYRKGQRAFLRHKQSGKRLVVHAGEARAGESNLKVKWEHPTK